MRFRAGVFLLVVSPLTCSSVASAHFEWFTSVALCYCMHLRLVLNDLYSNQDFNFYNEFTVAKFSNMHFFFVIGLAYSCLYHARRLLERWFRQLDHLVTVLAVDFHAK